MYVNKNERALWHWQLLLPVNWKTILKDCVIWRSKKFQVLILLCLSGEAPASVWGPQTEPTWRSSTLTVEIWDWMNPVATTTFTLTGALASPGAHLQISAATTRGLGCSTLNPWTSLDIRPSNVLTTQRWTTISVPTWATLTWADLKLNQRE